MSVLRSFLAGLRALIVLTLVCGVAYPLLVTLGARAMPSQADGSLVHHSGVVAGSTLLGEQAGPEWFQARPSTTEWSGTTSGGSNLALNSTDLATLIAERRDALRQANPSARGPIPPDAVTASFSGLDPHISPAYAHYQAPRIARLRDLPLDEVDALIDRCTQGRTAGFLGQPRVNTVRLNQELATLH